jgi:hypothetical protein
VKISDRLVERCSPYQLNAMAYLGGAGCLLVAVIGFWVLPTVALTVLIVVLLGATVGLCRLAALAICPKCGASPLLMLRPHLPSKYCPDCGQNLTVIVRYD